MRLFDQFTKSVDWNDGAVSLEDAHCIVQAYIDGQKDSYDSDQSPFAISMFNFSIDNRNFIQISIDSKTDYRVNLECKYKKQFWKFSWKSTFEIDYHVPSIQNIKDIVTKFYELEIDEFRSYYKSLEYKESKFIGIGGYSG